MSGVTLKAPLALSEPNEQACVEQMQLYTNDDELFSRAKCDSPTSRIKCWETTDWAALETLCLMQIKIIKTFTRRLLYCIAVVI